MSNNWASIKGKVVRWIVNKNSVNKFNKLKINKDIIILMWKAFSAFLQQLKIRQKSTFTTQRHYTSIPPQKINVKERPTFLQFTKLCLPNIA